MNKHNKRSSFDLAAWAYLLGGIPISIIVGYIVYFLGWDEPFHLTYLVIAAVIFLVCVVPFVAHLEKKIPIVLNLSFLFNFFLNLIVICTIF